jgi:hypothetical protein
MSKLAVGAAVATALTGIAYAQTPAPLTPAPQAPSLAPTNNPQPALVGKKSSCCATLTATPSSLASSTQTGYAVSRFPCATIICHTTRRQGAVCQ